MGSSEPQQRRHAVPFPANRPFISQSLSATAATVIDIPFPQNIHPNIPAGVESTSISSTLFFPFALSTKHLQRDFENALASIPRVSFLISDSFLWWTLGCATKLSFPRLAFYGFNKYALSVTKLVAENQLLHGPEFDVELITVPRFPWIKVTKQDFDDPSMNSSTITSAEAAEFMMNIIVAVVNSFGIVTNSFYELGSVFSDYWNNECGPKSIY